jgi:hypothetical protein
MRNPIVLILIILLLFGGFGSWHQEWGPYSTGGFGGLVVILLVLLLLGVI